MREVKLFPNPIRNSSAVTLKAEGSGIATVKLEIFNLAGTKALEQEAAGTTLELQAIDARGRPLANGVYLYAVTVRGFDGKTIGSEVRKLVILR